MSDNNYTMGSGRSTWGFIPLEFKEQGISKDIIEQKLDIIIDLLTPKPSLILTGKSVMDEYNKLEI